MGMVKNFYGEVDGKTIYDFSGQLNYRLGLEDRKKLVNELLYNEDGTKDRYFEEVFTQKFDLKSENDYDDIEIEEDSDVDYKRLTYTGQNISNVKLILNKEDNLYSETNLAKELEKIANYLLFGGDKDKKQEYKIYKDEALFNKMLKETSFGDSSGEQLDNTIHMLQSQSKNFKLEAKQVITDADIEKIPELKEYNDLLKVTKHKLSRISLLEKIFKKTKGFTNLDEITYEEECALGQFGIKKEELNFKLYREAQSKKALLQKHSALIKQDMLDIKDDIKGTIYFKSPLPDSTDIDYDLLEWDNEEHIEALLRLAPKGIDMQQDMVCIQYDVRKILEKCNLTEKERQVLKMFRAGLTLEVIGNAVGMSLQAVDKCIKKIVKNFIEEYSSEHEEWNYTFNEKGTYKKCSGCGQVKLASDKNFSKDAKGKLGYKSKCKKCRKLT